MTDIVERLRECCVHGSQEDAIAAMQEAAGEIESNIAREAILRAVIERLRAENKQLRADLLRWNERDWQR